MDPAPRQRQYVRERLLSATSEEVQRREERADQADQQTSAASASGASCGGSGVWRDHRRPAQSAYSRGRAWSQEDRLVHPPWRPSAAGRQGSTLAGAPSPPYESASASHRPEERYYGHRRSPRARSQRRARRAHRDGQPRYPSATVVGHREPASRHDRQPEAGTDLRNGGQSSVQHQQVIAARHHRHFPRRPGHQAARDEDVRAAAPELRQLRLAAPSARALGAAQPPSSQRHARRHERRRADAHDESSSPGVLSEPALSSRGERGHHERSPAARCRYRGAGLMTSRYPPLRFGLSRCRRGLRRDRRRTDANPDAGSAHDHRVRDERRPDVARDLVDLLVTVVASAATSTRSSSRHQRR